MIGYLRQVFTVFYDHCDYCLNCDWQINQHLYDNCDYCCLKCDWQINQHPYDNCDYYCLKCDWQIRITDTPFIQNKMYVCMKCIYARARALDTGWLAVCMYLCSGSGSRRWLTGCMYLCIYVCMYVWINGASVRKYLRYNQEFPNAQYEHVQALLFISIIS